MPTEFGPDQNLLWRLELPTGYSSPILFGDRIYVTGVRGTTLTTFALDRAKGTILWERTAPAEARPPVDKRNNPASPSVAVDANGVYVFFPDYGLVAYDTAGKELWKMPLGPFNNIYGMGASPVHRRRPAAARRAIRARLVSDGRRREDGPAQMEDAAARSEERPRDADPLARQRRARSDSAAGLVPAHGLRRGDRREALVGARACRSRSSPRR